MGVFVLSWWFGAEHFFRLNDRVPAKILVVEGWIGIDGVTAAKAEFYSRGYDWVVATGSLSGHGWNAKRWSFATEAAELLIRLGVDPARVLVATPQETDRQRTYESALAVRETLLHRGLLLQPVTIFTAGVHARRSRLVFAKVLGKSTMVGSVSWSPSAEGDLPWWTSSERAQDLLKESVAYPFELFLNSGRW